MFKFGFIELFALHLSLPVEMKGEVQALHQRAPPKEGTHGTFLRYLSP